LHEKLIKTLNLSDGNFKDYENLRWCILTYIHFNNKEFHLMHIQLSDYDICVHSELNYVHFFGAEKMVLLWPLEKDKEMFIVGRSIDSKCYCDLNLFRELGEVNSAVASILV